MGQVSQILEKPIPMENPMHIWKARVGQIDNTRADKLLIRQEVKVATPNTHVRPHIEWTLITHTYKSFHA